MACGEAEVLFVVGAVEIDVAAVRVSVFRTSAVQPKDAGDDLIIRRMRIRQLSGGLSAAEDGADWRIVPILFRDGEVPGGCAQAARFRARSNEGGRDGAGEDGLVLIQKGQALAG